MRLRRSTSARWQQVPDGVRDLLPADAARRSAAASALRDEFRRWGYREVVTPTLEFLETVLQGAGTGVADRLFKIVDRGGELLALRPEMTVPIARLAATRLLRDEGLPLRLSYVAPVFRGQDVGAGRLREFTQAGVELLGDGQPDADAEVIALAMTALVRAGVSGAELHIGDLGFLNDALSALPEEAQDEVRSRLYRREFAGIDGTTPDASVSRLLRALPDLHGPGALDRAGPFVRSARGEEALARLSAILDRLPAYGVTSVSVDLSIIRDFSYYTGVVFEAYGPGTGYPLLGGGRYDTLLARFGAEGPATGFAIGLERVLDAAPVEEEFRADIVIVPDGRRADAVGLAQELRAAGRSVIVGGQTAGGDGRRARLLVRLEGRDVRILDVRSEGERLVTREQFTIEFGAPPRVRAWSH